MHTLQTLLHRARRLTGLSPAGGATDGQLLERFRGGDDTAYELLLWRHGPMVLSVCRRILGDVYAAEDAFQAVFLALAQKAGSIDRGEAVGGWLYRVAHRIALRARLRAVRRAHREEVAGKLRAEQVAPEPGHRLEWEELRPLLDAAIAQLPEQYRTAFILCHLEGKTNEEAARELGCPVGTVQSRLSRARARLRSRLRKRDLGPDCIPFIFFIERPQVPADVPPELVHRTIRAALAFLSSRPRAAAAVVGRSWGTWQKKWLRRAAVFLLVMLPLAFLGAMAYAALTAPTNPPAARPPSPTEGMPTPRSASSCH